MTENPESRYQQALERGFAFPGPGPGRTELPGGSWIEHSPDGGWWEVSAPPAKHVHEWVTRGLLDGEYLERCACGAASEGDGIWFFIGNDKPRIAEKPEKRRLFWRGNR